MSRTRPTADQRQQMAYPCDLCGARPGAWCFTTWTRQRRRWATGLHSPRAQAAADNGQLPIDVPTGGR